jgi:hypothetical protein
MNEVFEPVLFLLFFVQVVLQLAGQKLVLGLGFI